MKMTMLAFAALILMSESAFAQEASAPAPAPRAMGTMGGQGQIVLAADLPFMNSNPLFAVVHESNSAANGGASSSSTIYAIAPSADYFVAPNVSVGGLIGIAHGTNGQNSNDATTLGIIVRGGYSAHFTESLSLWARLGIGYTHTSFSIGGSDVTLSSVPLIIEVPILWHPAPHFFVGAGPIFTTELSSSASAMGNSQDQSKTTDIGVTTMIGGYFGGV